MQLKTQKKEADKEANRKRAEAWRKQIQEKEDDILRQAKSIKFARKQKQLKELAPHEDIAPINSPLMEQVDANHGTREAIFERSSGISDAQMKELWKKKKKAIKAKMKQKLLEKYGSK